MDNNLRVTFGNKKLPKDTMIFNIPARITCPGRTAFCENKCYALKAERMYKQVLPARQNNFRLSRDPGFPLFMVQVIKKHAHKINRVRIHESGDFYNQAYLDKWYSIAEACPGVTFYAYTKSFYLRFSDKPRNFVLIASFDHTSRDIDRLNDESKRQYFANTFTIVDKNTEASCIQDCSVCDACWTGKGKNITVNVH